MMLVVCFSAVIILFFIERSIFIDFFEENRFDFDFDFHTSGRLLWLCPSCWSWGIVTIVPSLFLLKVGMSIPGEFYSQVSIGLSRSSIDTQFGQGWAAISFCDKTHGSWKEPLPLYRSFTDMLRKPRNSTRISPTWNSIHVTWVRTTAWY